MPVGLFGGLFGGEGFGDLFPAATDGGGHLAGDPHRGDVEPDEDGAFGVDERGPLLVEVGVLFDRDGGLVAGGSGQAGEVGAAFAGGGLAAAGVVGVAFEDDVDQV